MNDEDLFYNDLGNNISSIRTKKGISQDDLAKEIRLSRPSVANIEKGKQRPSIFTLVQISKLLEVSLSDLLPVPSQNSFEINHFIGQETSKDELNTINFKDFLNKI
ncbi:helix-turn-helix domain-containing protein [Myroides odoratimimus]|uniref:helix-turn-helix domain-containing protein n=1 Tax=Myroides odoratimimus TaxID=76832 RepID=UPI002DB7E0F1|nr:helix-turn-helix transcriptional regulator [Myroides odoratimimus]MEC4041900.1 helix-turn-helix transcriptional regulator [Myroides odoratimimus]MEC4149868.1 helix-turn-helix transcriptional regulator [Myroides odoratimimus]